MSLQSNRSAVKMAKMFIKEYFDSLSSKFSEIPSIQTRVAKCSNTEVCLEIRNLRSLQGYALTRFLNAEYSSYQGKPLPLNIGDPSLEGFATLLDEDTEIVTLRVPKSELLEFRGFLEKRREDVQFVMDNSFISPYLRRRDWDNAKRVYLQERAVS